MTNKIGPQIACRRRKKTQGRLTATSTPPSKSPTSRKEREKWGTRRAAPQFAGGSDARSVCGVAPGES